MSQPDPITVSVISNSLVMRSHLSCCDLMTPVKLSAFALIIIHLVFIAHHRSLEYHYHYHYHCLCWFHPMQLLVFVTLSESLSPIHRIVDSSDGPRVTADIVLTGCLSHFPSPFTAFSSLPSRYLAHLDKLMMEEIKSKMKAMRQISILRTRQSYPYPSPQIHWSTRKDPAGEKEFDGLSRVRFRRDDR